MTNSKKYRLTKVVCIAGQPFLFLFVLLLFASCNFTARDKVVCEVGDYTLKSSELQQRIELYYSYLPNDEARKKAMQQWAKEQQVKLAMNNALPKELQKNRLKNEDALLKLNLFSLENQYIRSHIDSVVTSKEILDFYQSHREDYKSKSYIVRALYIKVADSVDDKIGVDKLYLLDNKKDIGTLEKLAKKGEINYYFEPKRWIFLDDLMREIHATEAQKKALVETEKHAVFHNNGETHYINILDYSTKSVSSPFESEKMNIRSRILQERAYKLRDKAKEIILNHVKEKYPVTYN